MSRSGLTLSLCMEVVSESGPRDSIASNIYDEYSVGASIRPICTRCCFRTTKKIQVCSNLYRARVFIINTHADEIQPV